ncbi:MAG: FHA domain-containing protein [Anaerolineae bacterium]|nr:FHA domain-containing protein [Anaerolineae bacterium]
MTDKLTITKDELVLLLRAAHRAYQGQPKPPTGDDSWVTWYANFVIERLSHAVAKPPLETKPVPPPSSAAASSASGVSSPPERKPAAEAVPPVKPKTPEEPALPVTAKLVDQSQANDAGATSVQPIQKPNTDKLEDQPDKKADPDAGILQVCPTCAHRNRPGVYFCENCGTNLVTGQQASLGTRDLREAQDIEPSSVRQAQADAEPKKSSPVVQLDKEQEKAVRTAGSGTFGTGMLLRIEVEGGSTPIVIKPKSEDMILGRRDPTTGATPEVDLTAYAGYRMGVSRRHASLALENSQLNLWDLGSSNGTYLNGNKLTPHQPIMVRDGDEVRLGQMVLRLFFQNSPASKL